MSVTDCLQFSTGVKCYDEFSSQFSAQFSRFRDFWFMNFYLKLVKFFFSMNKYFLLLSAFTQLRKITFSIIFSVRNAVSATYDFNAYDDFFILKCVLWNNWIKGKQSQKNIDSFVSIRFIRVFESVKPRETRTYVRRGNCKREERHRLNICNDIPIHRQRETRQSERVGDERL